MNKNQHEDLLFQNLNILSDFKKKLYIHINFFFLRIHKYDYYFSDTANKKFISVHTILTPSA